MAKEGLTVYLTVRVHGLYSAQVLPEAMEWIEGCIANKDIQIAGGSQQFLDLLAMAKANGSAHQEPPKQNRCFIRLATQQ